MAAEGAILNEMLEIVARRAALRTFDGSTTASTSGCSEETRDARRRPPFESDVSGSLLTVVALPAAVAALIACALWWYANWDRP